MLGKVAFVTGAASGMGKAVVEKFLEMGALVAGFSLEENAPLSHPNFMYLSGDVTNIASCKEAIEKTIERYGKLVTLVHCAGITQEGSLETTSAQDFETMFKINTFGCFNVCKEAIVYLKKQPSCIVNISSDMGVKPLKNRIAYNPSKAALNMLTKCIALEYAPMVRCNSILPGVIDTPMIERRMQQASDPQALLDMYTSLYPMNRIGTLEDIVNGVVYLCSDASSWITGIELPICGGPI